jgi:hypothetical protein
MRFVVGSGGKRRGVFVSWKEGYFVNVFVATRQKQVCGEHVYLWSDEGRSSEIMCTAVVWM